MTESKFSGMKISKNVKLLLDSFNS
jgi:hypothetical protein